MFLDRILALRRERKTIFIENVWWKAFLPLISMYYFHKFCLQGAKIYV
jgi:hypothetical protein